jgi:pilus assembly protein Flp/PilA
VRPESVMRFIQRFWRDEQGATAIEYGMILALLALAITGVMGTIGSRMNVKFTVLANKLS